MEEYFQVQTGEFQISSSNRNILLETLTYVPYTGLIRKYLQEIIQGL